MFFADEPFLTQLVKRFDMACLHTFFLANVNQFFRVGRVKATYDDHQIDLISQFMDRHLSVLSGLTYCVYK